MKKFLSLLLIILLTFSLLACSYKPAQVEAEPEEVDPREFYYALHETAEAHGVLIEYVECTNELTEEYRLVGCRFNISNEDTETHFLMFNMYTEKGVCEFYGTSEAAVEFELIAGLSMVNKWVYFKVPLDATEVKLICEVDLYETECLTFEII